MHIITVYTTSLKFDTTKNIRERKEKRISCTQINPFSRTGCPYRAIYHVSAAAAAAAVEHPKYNNGNKIWT